MNASLVIDSRGESRTAVLAGIGGAVDTLSSGRRTLLGSSVVASYRSAFGGGSDRRAIFANIHSTWSPE